MRAKISDKTKKALILLVIIVSVIAFIFINSFQNAEASSNASAKVVEILSKVFGDDIGNKTHIIRKLAHFVEYSVLGIALSIIKSFVKDSRYNITTSLFIGLLVALIDETIQLFSIGRSGELGDVWIDFCGVLFGIALICLIKRRKNKKIEN